MKPILYLKCFALLIMLSSLWLSSSSQNIYFCGEKIPLDDKLVADKLMNFIKKQMNYVNLPSLKKRITQFMPQIEEWLRASNLPQDLKYIAIVESGFKTDVSSGAGAVGLWQLMPNTAREFNLAVNGEVDERKQFDESCYAACKVLAGYYTDIRKTFGISSWVLTAAAYNNGIGRIKKAITNQGKNYFSMNLNPETAAYVYKIIAVKELFEYPELYMKNFGYNVFNNTQAQNSENKNKSEVYDVSGLSSMKVEVNEVDGMHPNDLKRGISDKAFTIDSSATVKNVSAKITGKYRKFKDNEIVSMVLLDDLQVFNNFRSKGTTIGGRAWIIDDRVMIDLGYDRHVILFDQNNNKGIKLKALKNKTPVILKVITNVNKNKKQR